MVEGLGGLVERVGEGSHLGLPAAGSQLSDELKINDDCKSKLELSMRAQPAGRRGQNARYQCNMPALPFMMSERL